MTKRAWTLALAGAALLLAGCAERKAEVVVAERPDLRRPGCYTVDLFEVVNVEKPAAGVPEAYAAYLGDWGNGAWNGEWCHDLLIYNVHADGRVDLVDMHAPSETYRSAATAFKRTGRIQEDGSIKFAHGVYQRRYELRDGALHGSLTSSIFGKLDIILSRKGVVPLPPIRPAAMTQVTQAARPAG